MPARQHTRGSRDERRRSHADKAGGRRLPLLVVAHCLVATLAVLAALPIGNPDRPRETQRRIFIAAMALVPITLAVYVASIFL